MSLSREKSANANSFPLSHIDHICRLRASRCYLRVKWNDCTFLALSRMLYSGQTNKTNNRPTTGRTRNYISRTDQELVDFESGVESVLRLWRRCKTPVLQTIKNSCRCLQMLSSDTSKTKSALSLERRRRLFPWKRIWVERPGFHLTLQSINQSDTTSENREILGKQRITLGEYSAYTCSIETGKIIIMIINNDIAVL